MTDDSKAAQRRWALESFLSRFDELERVLGPDVAPVLGRVREELAAGVAERARGRDDAALERIGRAMADLAALGDTIGPAEGALMRALTEQFVRDLSQGDANAAEVSLDRIQAQAGRPKVDGAN